MRQAGSISEEQLARRFVDYLLTLGIESKTEPGGDGWAIWIFDENRMAEGKAELATFRQHSGDPKYTDVSRQADALRKQHAAAQKKAARNFVDMSQRWSSPGMRGPRRLTITLIGISVLVALLSNFGRNTEPVSFLYLSSRPATPNLKLIEQSGVDIHDLTEEQRQAFRQLWWTPDKSLPEVRRGEVWRLVTPIFLHFGMWHLLFNMYWLWLLGGMIEDRYGSPWFGVIVLVSAVLSNLLQNYWAGPLFGGMSGVDYALVGYVWMKSKFDPAAGIFIGQQDVFLMLLWFGVCFTGWLGPIANGAHLGGLIVGLVMGYWPTLMRRFR